MNNLRPLDKTEIDDFGKEVGFIPYLFIYRTSKLESAVVYRVDDANYNIIDDSFDKSDKSVLTPGTKLFVMPGTSYRKDQWIDFTKKNGYKLTTLDKCDVVVSNEVIQLEYGKEQPSLQKWGFGNFKSSNHMYRVVSNPDIEHLIIDKTLQIITSSEGSSTASGFHLYQEGAVIFPEMIRCYLKVKNGTKVITEKCLINELLPFNEITPEVYIRLEQMFSSSNPEDNTAAQVILYGCDTDKSIYFIWKLVRRFYYSKIINNRLKSSRNFEERANLNDISVMDVEIFMRYVLDNKLMTKYIWEELSKSYKQVLMTRASNPYFEVELKVNSKHSQYVADTFGEDTPKCN